MEELGINIAIDFSNNLGGRKKEHGSFSGEEFFEKILEKKYLGAKKTNQLLHIYLDGASPYGSSFLDESFGQLYRKEGAEITNIIVFHTEYFGWIVEYIKNEIWK